MPPQPSRILLCTGKIYYELLERREAQKREDVALVRLEQLYPLPPDQLASALERYPDETPAYWVQEEPENMGAWRYLKHLLGERLLGRFPFSGVSRPESGSPATGSNKRYRLEQQELLARAMGM
jgi:2-oxoglutarate dehydrogenase E1 component